MNAKELKEKVLSIDLKNIEDPTEKRKFIEAIKKTDIEDLKLYLKEYQDYVYFISAVKSLKLK